MDRARLLSILIDRQDQTAIEQLFIDFDGGGRQEDHHRTLDAILMRHELARRRIFAGGCDREHAFALQQLQRIGGTLRAFLFDDREDFVFEIRFAHVEQRLPRHGRVLHALFFGHQGEHRFHQRRFPGRRAGLHGHRKRPIEQPRHGREIGDAFVGFLTDHVAPRKVLHDAIEQPWIFEKLERGGAVFFRHRDFRLLWFERLADLFVLQLFELQQHATEVVLDDFFVDAHLDCRLFDERGALVRRVEIERIDVERIVTRRKHVDFYYIVAEILRETAHAVAAIGLRDDDLIVVFHINPHIGTRRWSSNSSG